MTLLAELVVASSRVSGTSSRLAKVREIAGLLRKLSREEIAIGVSYLAGELPQGRIGVGYAALQAAAMAAGAEGTAAAAGNASLEPPPLSIADTNRGVAGLAAIRGGGSAKRRSAALGDLFARASDEERAFLVRLLAGELRQGALAGVMVDAIAAASGVPVADVRRAAMYCGSLGEIALVAMTDGAAGLSRFQLRIFSPVAPMLAQTAADVDEALRELGGGETALEWKLDGARVQAHKDGERVRLYTRTLNEVTDALPEVTAAVRALSARALVLDGEAIAYDGAGRPHPFQITMRRFGRRLEVEKLLTELPVRAYFFDCLRLDDRSLAEQPLRERSEALAAAVPESLRVPRMVTASASEARAFYEAALAAGHEGLMAKSLDSPYEAGNRGASWLKIKRSHTLDLLVLAAEWGHGRRTGKLSNLHLGALDRATGRYVMLGKTFKGLTDEMLARQTEALLARELRRDQWTVYVRPELVVEIAFSDLQASSRYPGGLALRLARVKRYREDKRPEDADDMEAVRRIYSAQGGQAASADGAPATRMD
ncbi:MAG TPA: ATP-dependent DNA ligase [Steroidobacteraceae bacterium]|jgi:DNA ligase-1|nr:ATP-dependent DNA ligase [Steroidobacteraceae bacterium]